MHKLFKDLLQCPKCHSELSWNIHDENDARIINADITCKSCGSHYEIKNEIGMFLTPDLVRNDLWEGSASELIRLLEEKPDIKKLLLTTPEDELNGADHWYKAYYYEMNKDFKKSRALFEDAFKKSYTKEHLTAWRKQVDYIYDKINKMDSPIIDIASGRCYLVEKLLRHTNNYIMATDFSPSVLIRDQEYFKSLGLYNNLTLMAFDARRTPFKNNSIEIMTSNLGLQNIENPGNVINELSRICDGEFLSVMILFPEDDKENIDIVKKYGNVEYMTISEIHKLFSQQHNWTYKIINKVPAYITPTPIGNILEAGIDLLPVKETNVTFSILECRK